MNLCRAGTTQWSTAVVSTYPAPEFTAVVDDKPLRYHIIAIEIDRVKNKNRVAENAIREL